MSGSGTRACRSARILALAALTQGTAFGAAIHVGNIFAEGGGQIDLVVLLLHEDLANLFGHGKFSERLALPDSVAVIANGGVFVFEIEAQHLFWIFGCANRLRSDGGHFAQIIDLARED